MEVWELSGDMMAHPFHMHGVHFEVLTRGAALARVWATKGSRTQSWYSNPSNFSSSSRSQLRAPLIVYNCHTLEHEDAGMMGQYKTA